MEKSLSIKAEHRLYGFENWKDNNNKKDIEFISNFIFQGLKGFGSTIFYKYKNFSLDNFTYHHIDNLREKSDKMDNIRRKKEGLPPIL